MQELSNPPSQDLPTTTDTSRSAGQREIQRVALRDLVALATESAATEADIERKHQQAGDDAKREFQRAARGIEDRHKQAKETLLAQYQDKVNQIEQQHKVDVNTLNNSEQTARQRIDLEFKTTEREIKQNFDQAVWLAESVFEATQAQLRDEAKKTKEQSAAQLQAVNAMEEKAVALMRRYNQSLPAIAPVADEGRTAPEDPAAEYAAQCETGQKLLTDLSRLRVPGQFVGARPYVTGFLICAVAVGGVIFVRWGMSRDMAAPGPILIALGAAVVFISAVGAMLWVMAKRHTHEVFVPLRQALDAARYAVRMAIANAKKKSEQAFADALEKRKAEEAAAREHVAPLRQQSIRRRDSLIDSVRADYQKKMPMLQQQHERNRVQADEIKAKTLDDIEQKHEREVTGAKQRYEQLLADAKKKYEDSRAALESRLHEGLHRIQAPIEARNEQAFYPWNDPVWANWTPPKQFASLVRIGQLQVDLKKIADGVPQHGKRQLQLPEPFTVPVSLGFPREASLFIQAGKEGRTEAIRALQAVMARLLTSLPAGRVRFTIIDPVGLGQSFAGFMHLADHDDALVGGRIWTEPEQIEQRLSDLTEHMETVIQKYLRNEYETIDDYNAQAGELAEPYRFLVIADMPAGMQGDAFHRLSSIASTGARCGVYTLVFHDTRQSLASDTVLDHLQQHSLNLVWEDGRFVWNDDVFRRFPLQLDAPPADEFLTRILDVVGRNAKEAARVEVPFDTIAPKPDEFWSGSTKSDVAVPIGRMGATRLQSMRLGKGVAQHALIAGKTGSGKSNLLHTIVTNLAMWYSPDEVQFYLVDFKKGVEFKTYATHMLPHARAIAVESDREFGLSVLQRVDAELTRRGALFRKLGVQDIASYRQETGEKMPRTLLIIDEFQEFFSEDDKIAQDSGLLLDRLVRQGRAFGIHIVLGSQTIGGTSGLARTTIGQMAVRVALQCSEADSQMILGDNNSAARLLSRPGEAIYNDAGGLVEANSPFQIAFLPDDRKDQYLERVQELNKAGADGREEPIVFEGNAPADLTKNKKLSTLLAASAWPTSTAAPHAWIGEPVAIKDPTAVIFRRQSGANLLMVGQQEESALAIMVTSMISLAAQHAPGHAKFYILDGTPADSPLASVFKAVSAILPHEVNLVEYRAVPQAMDEIAKEMADRQTSDHASPPPIYLFIYGLQRYRALRHQEESFSFSASDEPKAPQPDKQFADILREGPALGIHILTWCDTAASIDRTLDRNGMREFDNRILFQMSATDSSNLIDSPMANKLGFHRALAFSEEQGVMEKFRPYALPDRIWLEDLQAKLKSRKV